MQQITPKMTSNVQGQSQPIYDLLVSESPNVKSILLQVHFEAGVPDDPKMREI